MANSKISALPSATTPLAGTETLPVVQGGITEQVSVANLTAGRTVSMSGATVTGLTASKPVFTDASDNLVSTGTVPTDQGGTGLTSFTANGVVYASSTTALATSAGLTYNGTTLATTGALQVDGNATLGDATTDTVTVNGYLGVGVGPNPTIALYARGTTLTGTAQTGVYSFPTGTSAATVGVRAFSAQPATAAAVFTSTNVVSFISSDAIKGAGSTITNLHGVYINDQTQGTNNYGITSLVSSGSNKWNIYASGTANNAFAGNVRIGSTTAPTNALDVTGIATVSSNLGLGITPSAWGTAFRALEANAYSLAGATASPGALYLSNNSFLNASSQHIYKNTAAASLYVQTLGAHTWYTAPSGTAGDVITFSQTMTVDTSGFLGVGINSPAARLHLAGNITAASWTTNGIGIRYAAATYTDSSTAASGTVASAGIHALARPTIAASNATVTYTNAATLYIANSPANGSNVTVTNPWSIWVDDGNVRFDGNEVVAGLVATAAAAPTIASAATIAPTTRIAFVSGTTTISTITAPAPISAGGGQITLIPTGLWATNTAGNIALATTAVVNRALILTYDSGTAKWYPSY